MKTLSFVIPVYNEEKRLAKTFKALEKIKLPDGLRFEEIIFVNDGSRDNSKFKIQNSKLTLEKKLSAKIKIISYQKNKGKGYAVKQGMLTSSSDYTLFFDADMSTPLSEIKKFIPFMKKDVDILIGTRRNGKSTIRRHQPKVREFLGRGFTFLSQIILGIKIHDVTCGFKAFSKKALTIVPYGVISGWGFDAEVLFLSTRNNLSIQEIPVAWSHSKGSKVNILKAIPQGLKDLLLTRWHHDVKHMLRLKKIFPLNHE